MTTTPEKREEIIGDICNILAQAINSGRLQVAAVWLDEADQLQWGQASIDFPYDKFKDAAEKIHEVLMNELAGRPETPTKLPLADFLREAINKGQAIQLPERIDVEETPLEPIKRGGPLAPAPPSESELAQGRAAVRGPIDDPMRNEQSE